MNMKKVYNNLKRSMLLLLWLASSHALFAQERVVSGSVKDENGSGMPGVNVLIKGTNTGTATDASGQYRLNVSGDGGVLVVSFIGYVTKEVNIGSQSTVDISMDLDVQTLTELVVTGYGVDKRRELTGAVSTVKSKDLTFAPSGNVEQMLQGRVAGVTVITNGQPGTTSQIRVRGFGAFGGNQPLYIVDGVPTEDIRFLNPDDIETTTVLKDAASASIYGARAAGGVIVYTTKKAKRGQKLVVTYDNMFGVTTPGEGQKMMNPTDFADWTWNAIKNTATQNGTNPTTALATFNHPQFGGGTSPKIPDYLTVGAVQGFSGSVDLAAEKAKYNVDPRLGGIYQVTQANKQGTDWYKAITNNAPILRQTLGFSGGGESNRFYVGLSAQNQDGILLNNSFDRYAARVNSEFDVLKNLRIGENMQFTLQKVLGLGGGNGGQGVAADENDILSAFRMPSIIPVYDVFGGYAGTASKGFNNPRNPVASRRGLDNNQAHQVGGFGNVYIEFDPIPGLTLRSSVGGNYNNVNSRGYSRWQYENSENNSAFGFNQSQGYSFGWTFTNTANYKKTFGDHSIDVIAGQEALNTGAGWNSFQSGLNPFSWDPNFVTMSTVSSGIQAGSNTFKGVNFSSIFGQAKYTFKDRYILSAVVRRDGSSRFGEKNRYGVFPAFSAAWRISSESFMQGISAISDLKIRGGYGTMGNSNNVDPNNQYSLYGGSIGASSYDIGGVNSGTVPLGFYRTRIGNSSAKWETAVTANIGIDGNFFDGKLDVVIDFWKKDTKDLLLAVPVTATAGVNAAVPSVNIAEMSNKGIDLMLGTKGNITDGVSFELTANGSFLKNEITSLAPGLTYITTINPGFRGITPIRNGVGQSISSFFGYKVAGLFQNAGEVSGAPTQSGAAPGRFRYEDINGDGKIDANDRTYIGSPVPKFTGGLNFTVRYSGFDLSAYLYTSLGGDIWNQSKWFTDFYPSFQGAAISERVKDSWTPTNTGATIPIFESASNFSTNSQASSFYIEKGDYLRLQNVTLGYTLPANMLDRLKMTKLRGFVSLNNLFTITGYSGLDPAVGGNADTNFGIDVGNYPVTRGFTAGINLGF
jgi:TonB-dependent starch-binding outer membrane protein SusC